MCACRCVCLKGACFYISRINAIAVSCFYAKLLYTQTQCTHQKKKKKKKHDTLQGAHASLGKSESCTLTEAVILLKVGVTLFGT